MPLSRLPTNFKRSAVKECHRYTNFLIAGVAPVWAYKTNCLVIATRRPIRLFQPKSYAKGLNNNYKSNRPYICCFISLTTTIIYLFFKCLFIYLFLCLFEGGQWATDGLLKRDFRVGYKQYLGEKSGGGVHAIEKKSVTVRYPRSRYPHTVPSDCDNIRV